MKELQSAFQRSLADGAVVTFEVPQSQEGDLPEVTLAKINTLLAAGPSGAAATQVMSTAFEASKVLKASAGKLHTLAVFNSGASAQYILLMNSATVPANGAVTLLYPPIPIAAGTLLVLDLPRAVQASTGIAVCNSSTGTFTKTIGAADCAFFAHVTD